MHGMFRYGGGDVGRLDARALRLKRINGPPAPHPLVPIENDIKTGLPQISIQKPSGMRVQLQTL